MVVVFRLTSWVWATLLLLGCGASNQPVLPEVEFSKARKIHKVDISSLQFPKGFPAEVSLLSPTKVYEQDAESDPVAWDTSAEPAEARDHYVAKFEEAGLETVVVLPPGMPGENYEVRGFSQTQGRTFCVGIGKQQADGQVGCFIFSREATAENWKTN
ncbi:MAG: hypothetical protein VX438_18540 [Planctomycetota bacterium]|nr:hypothetical protein [Planctomycetota bacterium]